MNADYEIQTRAILAWIKVHGSITHLVAEDELGIMRLAARIFDIRNGNGVEAHDIETRLVTVTNRFGATCRVAEYSIPKRHRPTPTFNGTPALFDY
jgi:hypothetical protein